MNQTPEAIHLTPEDFQWLTQQVFHNECGEKNEQLTCWNENNNFMSVGVGHFIWYPRDTKQTITESFPKVLDYMENAGHEIPEWLNEYRTRGCPWTSREDFLDNFDSDMMRKLREFLQQSFSLQIGYVVHSAQLSIEKITSLLPASEQQEVIDRFNIVARGPKGFYPLIDYLNFKGSGSNTVERYQGAGWGLLQVLTEMEMPKKPSLAKKAFVEAAIRVLERRISNSPPERNEERWLPGWKKRLQTYLG